MKVLLLFPPDWLPSEPYLSLPALTSVLRPAGHEVIQKDVNVEMYDMMFDSQFLHSVQKKIINTLHRLQQYSRTHLLEENNQVLREQLLICTKEEHLVQIAKDAEKAKEILRNQDFYDINKLEWANNCFHKTMDFISLAYYPAQICFPPFETDIGYKTFISKEILNAVKDERVNVYRDVFSFIISPVLDKEQPDIIGISVVQKRQLIPTFTFCKLIKEQYPDVHITLGGNIITRIRDVLVKKPELFELFDTAILYEGEHALLELVDTLEKGKKLSSSLPNLIYRDEQGIHSNTKVCAEDMTKLPPPDFDGLPLEKYFVPNLILPYLATRGCYWGRCTFCDHFQGYSGKFRTKPTDQIIEELKFLKKKYGNRHFHFTDESYPPALFRKVSRRLLDEDLCIAWTTHLRFEDTLRDEEVWKDASKAGCRYLHFGYESGNERVLKLMGKDTDLETIKTNLQLSAKYGIWNHCMGFFGFPGESQEEAEDSIRFLHKNKEYIHSVGFTTFALGKYSPIATEPVRFGVSVYKNPEWDLAMDYYYTPYEGLGIPEAIRLFEKFEQSHDQKWDLRTYIREYIFLYVDYFQTNKLDQLYLRPEEHQEHYQIR